MSKVFRRTNLMKSLDNLVKSTHEKIAEKIVDKVPAPTAQKLLQEDMFVVKDNKYIQPPQNNIKMEIKKNTIPVVTETPVPVKVEPVVQAPPVQPVVETVQEPLTANNEIFIKEDGTFNFDKIRELKPTHLNGKKLKYTKKGKVDKRSLPRSEAQMKHLKSMTQKASTKRVSKAKLREEARMKQAQTQGVTYQPVYKPQGTIKNPALVTQIPRPLPPTPKPEPVKRKTKAELQYEKEQEFFAMMDKYNQLRKPKVSQPIPIPVKKVQIRTPIQPNIQRLKPKPKVNYTSMKKVQPAIKVNKAPNPYEGFFNWES